MAFVFLIFSEGFGEKKILALPPTTSLKNTKFEVNCEVQKVQILFNRFAFMHRPEHGLRTHEG